jgi:cell division protein FtsW (lipid II flippase)
MITTPVGRPIARARRSTELGLVIVGFAITAAAYTLGALGRTATLPANIFPFLGVVLGLLLIAHIATRILAPGADPILLPMAALLNGIGYVFIARLDKRLAGLQATWTFVGIGAFIATLALVRRARDLRRFTWTFALVGLGLLMLPFVPHLGRSVNASRIWIRFAGINFQPGEFAKLALALFFAAYLVDRRELLAVATWRIGPLRLPQPRDLAPVLAAWALSLVIMTGQRDLGSSLLFFALFVVMLWVASERASYLAIGTLLFAGGAYGAWRMFDHVKTRVTIWLDPWKTAQASGYQIVQGAYALAWGGITGTGIGLGDPARVPAIQTDFILVAIGEELGLLGTTAVLAAYLFMVGSGLRIAIRAQHPFEKLLAVGLTTILGVQAFVIIGGVTRLVPLTGVTLPFVSYGGSSLVANYVLLALLLRISHDGAVEAGEVTG